MSDEHKGANITERISGAWVDLVDYLARLIAEGRVRRIIIRKPGGGVLLEISLAAGVLISGALALMVPVLTALGAIAALVAKVQVDIVRREGDE